MIKLRYEKVPYNHPHGAYSPANMRRDIAEAFAGKPEEELEYLTHKVEVIAAELRVILLKQKERGL